MAGNLDGVYLFLGVGGGALRIEGEWDSTVGAHGALFSYSEAATLSLFGVDLGMSQYGDNAGGRAWVAPTVATRALGPLVGISVGVSAKWDQTDPPKWGAAATLFAFAGITPTITIGRHERVGMFFEFGIRLSLPALRFSRRGLLSD